MPVPSVLGQIWPASHDVHALAFPREYVPSGQGSTVAALKWRVEFLFSAENLHEKLT